MKILIADDSIVSRHLLEATLRKWQYEVVVACDGIEAWNELQKEGAPSIAILDWVMPGLTGPEVTNLVRQRGREPYTYVLLLTSKSLKEDLIEGMEAGADDYLTKPFDQHELKVRLRAGTRIMELQAQLLAAREALREQATKDFLTRVWNRSSVLEILDRELARAEREVRSVGVVMLDLDRFKHINDSRGHETGDKLLKSVAQRIRATMRNEDVVVRMGGDEFIVVLKTVRSTDQVSEAASRITEALSAPIIVDGRPLVTTASIGVSLYPRDGADMGELLRHSDTAMYQAKDRGRNNFQLFSPIMARRLKERMAIETSLRTALNAKQLDVHYQPIVDISSRRVVALESLLRWKHPSHGFIPPERFVAVAEECGLIVPIGEFVLARAVEDLARWRQAGCVQVPVAVNISAVQLQRSNLPATITTLTQSHNVSPKLLQLELTESAVFERREGRTGESNEDAVARLRELGVRIAIDDFGTGYSSLSYLKRWRVDYLKIDRSFVRDLVTDMSDLAIVGAIIAMAHHLHI
jgi:diguanylate cyclase (GGDEF)-like protein